MSQCMCKSMKVDLQRRNNVQMNSCILKSMNGRAKGMQKDQTKLHVPIWYLQLVRLASSTDTHDPRKWDCFNKKLVTPHKDSGNLFNPQLWKTPKKGLFTVQTKTCKEHKFPSSLWISSTTPDTGKPCLVMPWMKFLYSSYRTQPAPCLMTGFPK